MALMTAAHEHAAGISHRTRAAGPTRAQEGHLDANLSNAHLSNAHLSNTALGAVVAGQGPGRLVQGGFFDDLLGTVGPGLLGAASSALSGDRSGALGQVRSTGAGVAPMLAESGAGALGGLIGGQAGETVSALGAPLGQGLSSVISGEATPGQAAGGLLSAAQPAILSLLMSLLRR